MTNIPSQTIDGNFSVRLARVGDLPFILEVERASPGAAHWQKLDYQRAISQSERLVLVAEEAAQLVGFLVASIATEEWELENIAVAPAARRRGAGRALIRQSIVAARRAKAIEIRQEIRASNTVAHKLGQSVGFVQEGRRRGYYRDPAEDALLFKYLVRNPRNGDSGDEKSLS